MTFQPECGHMIGAVAGDLSLAAFGLLHQGPALAVGVSGASERRT